MKIPCSNSVRFSGIWYLILSYNGGDYAVVFKLNFDLIEEVFIRDFGGM